MNRRSQSLRSRNEYHRIRCQIPSNYLLVRKATEPTPTTLQAIAINLGSSPDLDTEILYLEAAHTLAVEESDDIGIELKAYFLMAISHCDRCF